MTWPGFPAFLLAAAAAAPPAAGAHPVAAWGPLVSVEVEVEGRPATLYPAPDGTARRYLEARQGARYTVVLTNRTAERLGVALSVDGLNVVSGRQDPGRGRMYVLGPWEQVHVRGWRSSLDEVRRFVFVDERASYAARSGQANARLGWIEAAVYRERARPWPLAVAPGARREAAPSARSPEAPGADDAQRSARRADTYPGTGWGDAVEDRATLVRFVPETAPAERTSLRYEHRSGLVALGVLPPHPHRRDRLWERDRGDAGFARPPLW
jgi:hypothetical protein